MNKIALVLFGLVIVLSTVLKTTIVQWHKEKQEEERIQSAFESNTQVLKRIETLEGKMAAQSNVIELKVDELSRFYPDIKKEIQNLKIKISRVEHVAQTSFQSEKRITTLIKDTLITDTVKAKVFNYKDEYYTIKGIAVKDTQHVNIQMCDTLLQTVYWGKRKKPFLWIFSKRQLEQRVSLKNPNARIEYSKLIKVVK